MAALALGGWSKALARGSDVTGHMCMASSRHNSDPVVLSDEYNSSSIKISSNTQTMPPAKTRPMLVGQACGCDLQWCICSESRPVAATSDASSGWRTLNRSILYPTKNMEHVRCISKGLQVLLSWPVWFPFPFYLTAISLIDIRGRSGRLLGFPVCPRSSSAIA